MAAAHEESRTALLPYQPPRQLSTEEQQALRATIGGNCTDAQFTVFIAACNRLQLDPFARQIVPIVKDGKMTPQATIDGFRVIAERSKKYAGQLGPFWCGTDGVWREAWLADGPPAAAKVGVLRRDFAETMWGVARFKSYNKGGTWSTMPDVMTAKVAEALALRKTFPQDLSGVYTEDELGDVESPDPAPSVTTRANPRTTTVAEVTPQQQQPSPSSATQQHHNPANVVPLGTSTAGDAAAPVETPAEQRTRWANSPNEGAYAALYARAQQLHVSEKRWREAKGHYLGDTGAITKWLDTVEQIRRGKHVPEEPEPELALETAEPAHDFTEEEPAAAAESSEPETVKATDDPLWQALYTEKSLRDRLSRLGYKGAKGIQNFLALARARHEISDVEHAILELHAEEAAAAAASTAHPVGSV